MSRQDVHNGHRSISNPNVGCVDFYHVDSMEFLNYLPVYQQLPNAMMVAVPQPEWFDLDRAVAMFEEANTIKINNNHATAQSIGLKYFNLLMLISFSSSS